MTTTCENYLDDLDLSRSEANWTFHFYVEPRNTWFDNAVAGHPNFDEDWRQHISSMFTDYTYILGCLIHDNWEFNHPYRMPYYLRNCIEADEFSMDGLLSTMLTADPTQVEYFVGLVDAYRQSIWNRPFNKDFYAALGRGFMQWP